MGMFSSDVGYLALRSITGRILRHTSSRERTWFVRKAMSYAVIFISPRKPRQDKACETRYVLVRYGLHCPLHTLFTRRTLSQLR